MSKVKGEFLISVDFFFKDQIYIYIFLDSKYGLFLLLSNRTHLITFFFIQQVLSSHPFYPHQCIHVNPNLPVHPTTTPPLCDPPNCSNLVSFFAQFKTSTPPKRDILDELVTLLRTYLVTFKNLPIFSFLQKNPCTKQLFLR